MKRVIVGLFVILLVASVFFWRERIIFSDASFISFRIINTGSLQIQEHRYGSFITQIFPLTASLLHLPLNWVLILYSASFNLFYLLIAVLLVYKFRNYSLAMLMSFYYVLFVSDTWFWTNNEVHQGIAWMFLFYASITYPRQKKYSHWISIPVFIILAFLSIFSHPLILFPAVFLWIFFMVEKKQRLFTPAFNIIYSVLLIAICAAKFYLSTSGKHYDSDKLLATTHVNHKVILNAFTSPMAKEILRRCAVNYWLVPLLFITGCYYGVRQKKFIPLLLTLAFCVVYFLAVCITFDSFFTLYIESQLMPLTIIAATPFVYYAVPKLEAKHVTIILAAIFLVRLFFIGNSASKFIQRKEWLYAVLQTMNEKGITKGIISKNEELRRMLMMNWAVPYESMLASSLQHDDPNLTFTVSNSENLDAYKKADPHQMITEFESINNSALNKTYFNLDTSAHYQLVPVNKN